SSYKMGELKDDNWMMWKEKIETVLQVHEVHGHIDGTCKRPTDPNEKKQWEKDDQIARTIILINLKDEQVVHVS
ncbi:hypothetical protein BDR06DRAFT_888499, partial [Suillus hirtellus]